MKLSYPVATPEVRAAILGAKGAPGEILPALRDAGYAAIEPFVGDPDAFDSSEWIAAVQRSGLAVAALGTGPVVFDHKLTFTDPDASVRRAAVARAKTIVDLAARLGTQVNIGKLRGDLAAGDAAQTSRDWMRAAFDDPPCGRMGGRRHAGAAKPHHHRQPQHHRRVARVAPRPRAAQP